MAIEYTWEVRALSAYPQHEGLPKVVNSVRWALRGVDSDGNSAARVGESFVDYNSQSVFTHFENLTESQVLDWVIPSITEDDIFNMKAEILSDIDHIAAQRAKNIPEIFSLPWA
jgi:hypothetical protein